jgi:hypothetical protein
LFHGPFSIVLSFVFGFCSLVFFFGLVIEPMAKHMLGQHCTTQLHSVLSMVLSKGDIIFPFAFLCMINANISTVSIAILNI